jgi:exosortase J
VPNVLSKTLQPRFAVALAVLCAAAGLLTVSSTVTSLLYIWRTDDLKSMGLVVPFVCFGLILRAWKSIGWRAEGSWWGFALLAGAALLVFVRNQMLLIVTVNKDWLLQLPPLPLLAVIYAAGMVLLFGGKRLLRAAWFPVLLMWAVIPVPQTFSSRIDLPLQHASATVARAFAHALGQPLTQDKLRLMFTPDFGMFIAPGCNGIRGAITLGLAAIVVGYMYRFRWFVFAPVVAGAVMLGYAFNFLRLCLLVVYYKLALPYPWMQHHAKIADYIIGGCLFVCALAIFFYAADKLRQQPKDTTPAPHELQPVRSIRSVPYLARVAAILVLAAIFGAHKVRGMFSAPTQTTQALPPMPQQIGAYKLVRTWTDTLSDGIVVYTWGEYAAADASVPHVSLGISPELGVHDAEVCHIARGEDPTWHGQIDTQSLSGGVSLTAATYNDGRVQKLEASTVCDGGACRQYSQTGQHVTLVYARPHRTLPIGADTTRAVPVLLKVESTDTTTPVSVVEPQLAAGLAHFLAGADLSQLTAPFARR